MTGININVTGGNFAATSISQGNNNGININASIIIDKVMNAEETKALSLSESNILKEKLKELKQLEKDEGSENLEKKFNVIKEISDHFKWIGPIIKDVIGLVV